MEKISSSKTKTFFSYVIPSVLAFALSGVYTIVDGFYIGRSLGGHRFGCHCVRFSDCRIHSGGTRICIGGLPQQRERQAGAPIADGLKKHRHDERKNGRTLHRIPAAAVIGAGIIVADHRHDTGLQAEQRNKEKCLQLVI